MASYADSAEEKKATEGIKGKGDFVENQKGTDELDHEPELEIEPTIDGEQGSNPIPSDVVESIPSVTESVYNDKPRGRFLVRLNEEYEVSDLNISNTDNELSEKGTFSLSEDSSQALSQLLNLNSTDITTDIHNVKSYEEINTLYLELNEDEVNLLLNSPMVASIEEDKPIIIADLLTEIEPTTVKESSQTIPWGIHASGSYIVNAEEYKEKQSVKVAVFDTGVSPHPDLNIAGGVSFVDSIEGYEDDKGHGTHVAGIIGALDNSIGVVGASPEAEIYAVKVMDSKGDGYTSSVIEGLEWAIHNDIDIVNMSFVSSRYSEALHNSIQNAVNNGLLIIAAAGNEGKGQDLIQYPAKYPEVLAVGAVDSSFHRTDYSSTGAELDLVAPGFGVLSTMMNGDYGVSSGTSVAAAHVTGSAALLWSQNRSWDVQELTNKLLETATSLGDLEEYGKGLINVAKAAGVINGSIAPLSNENLSGLNTVLPRNEDGDVRIASYDKKNDGATIFPGESVTVSLKLEGDSNNNNNNPHQRIEVQVYPASNPTNIIATETILNPNLDVEIPYRWVTSTTTPTGTYYIKYHYPARPNFDDIFVIYVAQPGNGTDTYEPNDTFLKAYGVNPNNSYVSYISSSSDIDYYKLTADKSGEVTVDLRIPTGVDYELAIYSEAGTVLGEGSSGTGVDEQIIFQVESGKNYFIKVSGFSGQYSRSPYTLSIGQIETQPFPAPTGLEAVAYSNSIKLTWNPSPNATSYSLRINGTEVPGGTQLTTHTFTNLQPSTGYKLEVAVVYVGGKSKYASIQVSTSIPELIVYNPEDVEQPAGSNQLFSFKPATTGIYKIYTSPYQGNGGNVDTELSLYSNIQLNKEIATNDDANSNTVFSEIVVSLVGNQTYYVKVSGFDSTPLRTRITAEVVNSDIPYIQLDQPIDINQPLNSNVYVFVPSSNGNYRVSTSRYNGSSVSKPNDTELTVYAEPEMENAISNGYNDDKQDSVYSEVNVNLSAGTTYYIRVTESKGRSVYARLLVTSAGQTSFTNLEEGVAVDVSKASGDYAYHKFTPNHSGKFRFFTSNFQGQPTLSDTEIALYSDPDLQNVIDVNDDVKGFKPYGELFSNIEVNLEGGKTYYLVTRNAQEYRELKTRLTVESMSHSSASSAQNLDLDTIVEYDGQGNRLRISSLYDIDYYRIVLNSPQQLNFYISEGEGAIEDSNGNIRGYFSPDGNQAFDLDSGIYYLRVEKNVLHSYSSEPVWNFSGFTYEISVDINIFNYIYGNYEDESDVLRMVRAGENSLDATPGSGDVFEFYYKNKTNHSSRVVQVWTASGTHLVYQTPYNGDFKKGTSTRQIWNGTVTPTASNKNYFAHYAQIYGETRYWAKNGVYKIYVFRMEGKKKKDIQQFTVRVFNDPLHRLNVIPVPPKKYNNKTIVAADKNKCKECREYFEKYILLPGDIPETAYVSWFGDTYGRTGIEKFWKNAEKLVTCQQGSIIDQFQCTLDTIGMVPFLGEGADAVNGVVYLIRKDYANALLSTAAMIPVAGNGFTGAKKFNKIYKYNPCGCLPEGTIIKTKSGDKPIENIKVGDLVLAKDTNTDVVAYKPVEQLFKNSTNEIYILNIAGLEIETTSNHPFWINKKGWVNADELVVGDEVETENGLFKRIDSISTKYEPTDVYNFTVQDFHTYYVSDLGVLTHNLIEQCQIIKYSNVTGKMLTKRSSGGPSAVLEAEIKKATGMAKPTNWAAHHIVPFSGGGQVGDRLRKILKDAKIDRNSSANGVYLPREKGVSTVEIDGQTMATHNGAHVEQYYAYVLNRLDGLKDPTKIMEELNDIREELLTGKLKLGNI